MREATLLCSVLLALGLLGAEGIKAINEKDKQQEEAVIQDGYASGVAGYPLANDPFLGDPFNQPRSVLWERGWVRGSEDRVKSGKTPGDAKKPLITWNVKMKI